MRPDRQYFADWLSRTLAEKSIAQGDVARALGVTDSAISRWTNGKVRPELDSVMKLAAFLDVEPVSLAVTAGHMDADAVGVQPLPLPASVARRNLVRERLKGVKGLTTKELNKLLETFDHMHQGGA